MEDKEKRMTDTYLTISDALNEERFKNIELVGENARLRAALGEIRSQGDWYSQNFQGADHEWKHWAGPELSQIIDDALSSHSQPAESDEALLNMQLLASRLYQRLDAGQIMDADDYEAYIAVMEKYGLKYTEEEIRKAKAWAERMYEFLSREDQIQGSTK